MLISKKGILKPLLESTQGTHLSIYLQNDYEIQNFKNKINDCLDSAHEVLSPVMTLEARNKFLEPIENLKLDTKIFKQIKGNIGIFRTQNLFRVISLPVAVEDSCHVATTFHVKPLLKWLQSDLEFLLIGINKDYVNLYSGSQNSFQLLDSILISESEVGEIELMIWLDEWISQAKGSGFRYLYFAGEKKIVDVLKKKIKNKNLNKEVVSQFFHQDLVHDFCYKIRRTLRNESSVAVDQALTEFYLAEEYNKARQNIFLISKAVVQGRVKKLIISAESSIHGKVDPQSGGLALHPCDLDHEDDDIIDDLAQLVLKQGGEVVVASKADMPNGRPLLAILDEDQIELQL